MPPSPCGPPGPRLVQDAVAIEQRQAPESLTADRRAPVRRAPAVVVSPAEVVVVPAGTGAGSLGSRSDADLVSCLSEHGSDAYSELYRRHARSVASAARTILVTDERCEDVVAEVFVSLWFFPEKFDPARGTLLAYLRLNARSRSIDVVRREEARTRREVTTWPRIPVDDADAALVGAESAVAVRSALVLLPVVEREPIVLAFFAGLTYPEVAVRLGLPEGTVKSRIRAGLRRLQRNRRLLSLRDTGDRDAGCSPAR